MSIPRQQAEAIALSLAIGKGVVIRDRQGCASPVLGTIANITDEHALVKVEGGRLVRFERSTGFALLAGEHDRWQINACGPPSSEEYDGLLTRQARLEAERDRLGRELDLVTAVLKTADDVALGGPADTPEGDR
jgi:hypothetical protein